MTPFINAVSMNALLANVQVLVDSGLDLDVNAYDDVREEGQRD